MKMALDQILKLVDFTHKFQRIQRIVRATGEERWENDAEHSYQLALVGWYIVSANNLDLNIDKVVKYAITHDLVEIYAGDTYIFSTDTSLKNSKVEREEEALERIKREFSEFPEMSDLIEKYEKKEDKESRFIYALDKVLPVMNIYLDGGRTWREEKVKLSMLLENKTAKIALSDAVKPYWDELVEILQNKEKELFGE